MNKIKNGARLLAGKMGAILWPWGSLTHFFKKRKNKRELIGWIKKKRKLIYSFIRINLVFLYCTTMFLEKELRNFG